MTAKPAPSRKNAPKTRGKPFQKGNSGRPRGARNRTTVLLEKIMADDAEEILEAVTKKAKEGDLAAAKLILDRVCPPRKDRPVTLDLPEIKGTKDLVTAMAKVIEVAAKGEITPAEAQGIANLIEVKRRTIEIDDIGRRLAALEAQKERRRP
jgi:hypothetical protein